MAARKDPQRKRFLDELETFKKDLPKTYSNLVFSKIRKPATIARVKDPVVLARLSTLATAGVYFNRVVKAQAVDFVVLDVLREVASEHRATHQSATA